MSSSVRVLIDIVLRSAVLLVLSEGVAAAYAAAEPDDDGLGTGLTAMFVLVCVAAGWGIWDGFHQSPVRLCVTWVATGAVVSLGSALVHDVRVSEWSGLVFWAGLVFVPAIACGIMQSILTRGPGQRASHMA